MIRLKGDITMLCGFNCGCGACTAFAGIDMLFNWCLLVQPYTGILITVAGLYILADGIIAFISYMKRTYTWESVK